MAVAPLASGGAPDVLVAAKLTPYVDFSASEPSSVAVGVSSTGTLSVLVVEGASVAILGSRSSSALLLRRCGSKVNRFLEVKGHTLHLHVPTPYPVSLLVRHGSEGIESGGDGWAGTRTICRHDSGR